MNEMHVAFHCNQSAQRIFIVPQTNKDLMYNYTTEAFGKPVHIHSKRQLLKLKKQHGIADCTVKEALSVKPKLDKNRNRKFAKQIVKTIYERGGMDYVLGKENPNGRDNLGRKRQCH